MSVSLSTPTPLLLEEVFTHATLSGLDDVQLAIKSGVPAPLLRKLRTDAARTLQPRFRKRLVAFLKQADPIHQQRTGLAVNGVASSESSQPLSAPAANEHEGIYRWEDGAADLIDRVRARTQAIGLSYSKFTAIVGANPSPLAPSSRTKNRGITQATREILEAFLDRDEASVKADLESLSDRHAVSPKSRHQARRESKLVPYAEVLPLINKALALGLKGNHGRSAGTELLFASMIARPPKKVTRSTMDTLKALIAQHEHPQTENAVEPPERHATPQPERDATLPDELADEMEANTALHAENQFLRGLVTAFLITQPSSGPVPDLKAILLDAGHNA